MRALLDRLYLISGALAALCIVLIALIVSAQVICNLITKIGVFGVNLMIPSYADISGYLLAAASFLGFAYTLARGGHIRVTLFTSAARGRLRYLLDLLSVIVGTAVSGAGTWFVILMNRQSFVFDDKSSGIIAIPIWIVQLPLSVGLSILTIAFADMLWRALATGLSPIPDRGREG